MFQKTYIKEYRKGESDIYMNMFEKWKNGFKRKCKDCGKIWYCSPSHAKSCISSKQGLTICICNGHCDNLWRRETGYFGEMKEVVEFT